MGIQEAKDEHSVAVMGAEAPVRQEETAGQTSSLTGSFWSD